MNEIVMVGEGSRAQQTKLSFTTVFPSVQLHCKVMDINLFKGWGFLIDAILRIFFVDDISYIIYALCFTCFWFLAVQDNSIGDLVSQSVINSFTDILI